MTNKPVRNERALEEDAVIDQFLDDPNEDSFAALFKVFSPQVVSFLRSRSRQLALAEDLAQEVMLTVYRKAGQIRDRSSFRAWLFKVAHNALYQHYGRLSREGKTVNLDDVGHRLAVSIQKSSETLAFEFRDLMVFLGARERDVMVLRFVEQWEYHEIAAARGTPMGTVQWSVANSKKKLARYLASQPIRAA